MIRRVPRPARALGVLYRFVEPILGSGAGVNALKSKGKECKFLTSNSMIDSQQHITKMGEVGITDVKEEDIIFPGKAILRYILNNLKNKCIFSLCSPKLNNYFMSNQVEVISMRPVFDVSHSNFDDKIIPRDRVDAVVMDADFNITYSQLARAVKYLEMDNCALLIGSADDVLPIQNDFNTLGFAGFVNILRESSGVEPEIFGKPGPALRTYLGEHIKTVDTNRILFIGSNTRTDIKFGQSCGFQTLLTLTGSATKAEMYEAADEFKPNYYVDNIADFAKFFEK